MSKASDTIGTFSIPPPGGTWDSSAGRKVQTCGKALASQIKDLNPTTGRNQVVRPMFLRSKNERDYDGLSDCVLLHFTV